MGDDDQLEIRVALTLVDDTAQYQGQSLSGEIIRHRLTLLDWQQAHRCSPCPTRLSVHQEPEYRNCG
jgi:hypothetical protein